MVKEVVSKIVADVAEDATTVDSSSGMPAVGKDSMGKIPEGGCKHHEESGRHDQSILIHGQVMVNTMEQEVQSDANTVVGEVVVKMEQESVKAILGKSPEEDAKGPIPGGDQLGAKALRSQIGAVGDPGQPNSRDHPPRGQGEGLEKVAKERRGFTALVMARAMDLVQVKFLAESAEPDLREEGTAKIKELVLLVVIVIVRLLIQVFLTRHAGSGVDGGIVLGGTGLAIGMTVGVAVTVGRLLGGNESNQRVIKDFICCIGMGMRSRVLEDLFDIATGVVEDEIGTARMVVGELGHIVNFVADSDIARLLGVVRLDLSARKGWERSSRHV